MFQMSVSTSILLNSSQVLLRWSDGPNSPCREEVVDLVEAEPRKILTRGALEVTENTQVHLIGNYYIADGVIRSCQKDGTWFLATIAIDENSSVQSCSARDPGIFAVEDFLTEQQEAEILMSLGDDTPRAALSSGGSI